MFQSVSLMLCNLGHPSWLICCMMEILVLSAHLPSVRYKI